MVPSDQVFLDEWSPQYVAQPIEPSPGNVKASGAFLAVPHR